MRPTFATFVALVSTAFATPIADDNYGRPSQKTYVAKYDDFQVDQYDGWIPPTSGDKVAMSFGGSGNFSVPAT